MIMDTYQIKSFRTAKKTGVKIYVDKLAVIVSTDLQRRTPWQIILLTDSENRKTVL